MDLHFEVNRLKTFEFWDVPFINKHDLALLGFYYNNDRDIVKCIFCGVEIGMWERGDDVLTDHIKWSPSCTLLTQQHTKNVPINQNKLNHILKLNMNRRLTNTVDEGSIQAFEMAARRLESYENENWPETLKQKTKEFSDAGFFYTGIEDRVLCFNCGGGLKDWEINDDPWLEHKKWYGYCNFVKSQPKPITIERKYCQICYQNEYDTIFQPCGHVIACAECAEKCGLSCPVCRQPFEKIQKIFFA